MAVPLTEAAKVIGGGGSHCNRSNSGSPYRSIYHTTALVDTITGHKIKDEVFLDNILTIGATIFALVSGIAAILGLAAVEGSRGGSLALAGGGTMALDGGLIIGVEGGNSGSIRGDNRRNLNRSHCTCC